MAADAATDDGTLNYLMSIALSVACLLRACCMPGLQEQPKTFRSLKSGVLQARFVPTDDDSLLEWMSKLRLDGGAA